MSEYADDYELVQYVIREGPKGDDKLAWYFENECQAVFAWLDKRFPVLNLGVSGVAAEAFIHLKEYGYSSLKCYRGEVPLKVFISTMVGRRLAKQAMRRVTKDGEEISSSNTEVTPQDERKQWHKLSMGPKKVAWENFIPLGKDVEATSYAFDSAKVEVFDLLSILPVEQQRILCCRFMDGRTAADVAAMFNKTPSQIDTIVSKARARLQAALASRYTSSVTCIAHSKEYANYADDERKQGRTNISTSRQLVADAASVLSEREKKILVYRYKKRMSCNEIGCILNLSDEEVKQIQETAESKLQREIVARKRRCRYGSTDGNYQ